MGRKSFTLTVTRVPPLGPQIERLRCNGKEYNFNYHMTPEENHLRIANKVRESLDLPKPDKMVVQKKYDFFSPLNPKVLRETYVSFQYENPIPVPCELVKA